MHQPTLQLDRINGVPHTHTHIHMQCRIYCISCIRHNPTQYFVVVSDEAFCGSSSVRPSICLSVCQLNENVSRRLQHPAGVTVTMRTHGETPVIRWCSCDEHRNESCVQKHAVFRRLLEPSQFSVCKHVE
jgi:hypothetical protein